ncbi:DEAD-box ATP-dependent RNA helicase 38-like isoform X2 [Camellia sinensis]|uniref:DEAD-box ATP-dependent RNA helicase 38-like isoform X2 n=1 Tax=Camellia sinensis TaxID=4442 RepID=UPI001036E21D|nr:DEAD-box ATP-dependent RNA helicase 38-like isoform X2 [Camellia sinensis]
MADTDSITAAAASCSAAATVAEAKPPETKLSWGDIADEPEEKDAPSTSDEKSTSDDLKIESLAIDETKKVHKFLDDPEDSNIKVIAGDTMYNSAKSFEDLKLSPDLLKGLYVEMKFERPSKIQAISLPMILTPPYKHLIAQAHNGSGKTTCFVLGMLSRVDPKVSAPQALCICPTRELAIQNMEVLKKMGKYTGITSECAIPMDSTNYMPISKRPPIMAQVVIGTPGTINKWVSAKKLGMSFLRILVFDEADHMLAELIKIVVVQSGFKDDSVRIMKAIVRSTPDCQVLLFSATFDDAVRAFVSKIVKDLFQGDYNQMFVNKEELSLESVKQYKVKCPDELAKIMVIKDRIFELGQRVGQTIIFVRTRNSASMLHKALTNDGYKVTTIQGALKQEDRDKIVKEFKDGLTQVLISTDLLARGFDQPQVNLVVNFDLPVKHDSPSEPDCEVYLHRVWRAGRFGRKGAVLNLLCNDRDVMIMAKIERHFNMEIAEDMSRRVSARASKKARDSSSSASLPPPPPSPPSSPPPPGDLPRPEWASRPLHKLTQFNMPFFQRDEDTTWAVEQLRLRQQLGICAVTAPTYPRLVRLFYQNLYETTTDDGLLSNIDGQAVHITSSMIATVLGFLAKPKYQLFPAVEDRQPIYSLIQQYFSGGQGDLSFTCLRRSKLPSRLLFLDSVVRKNVLPLGPRAELRLEFVRLLHGYQYGYQVPLAHAIWMHLRKFLREAVRPNPMQNLTWPLPFANLLTLVFELNHLRIAEDEEIDRGYPTFGQREWQHSISRILQPVGVLVDEAQYPVHDHPPHPVPPVPPQGDPLYMTREKYLQLQHSVDQVHSTLRDHHQSLMELRRDFQAHRDYSRAIFDQLLAHQQRVQEDTFETRSLMQALFAQHLLPPPPPPPPASP